MKSNLKKAEQARKSYDTSFKEQAVALAKEIGVKEAKDKLGIKNEQTLGSWVRKSRKSISNSEDAEFLAMREEIKKLKKELEREKKVTAILKDATAFFCQDHLK